jgi:hypothetical protein
MAKYDFTIIRGEKMAEQETTFNQYEISNLS